MDRKEYISMCQVASIKASLYTDFRRIEWNTCELVQHNDRLFYPEKCILGFDKNGQVTYSVQLHDLRSNSIVIALLDKVNRAT